MFYAAVLAIIGNIRLYSFEQGHETRANRWCELIDLPDTKSMVELDRRSWHWPPAVHNALSRRHVSYASQAPV